MPVLRLVLLAAFALLACTGATAQDGDTVAVSVGPAGVRVSAGNSEMRLGALVQADARFFASEGDVGTDQFLLRRARFYVQGNVGRVSYRVVPDFGQGRVDLDEAWAQVAVHGPVNVRAGYQKVPVGLERLRSSSTISFVERALPTAVVPDTDVGVALQADLGAGVSATAGVFNGSPDGQGATGDAGDGKDIAARLFAQPFAGALSGLGMGIAASYGREVGTPAAPALARYRTATGRVIAAFRTGDTTAVAAGTRFRVAPQASFAAGPVSAMTEWVLSSQSVAVSGASRSIEVRAWQVAGTFVLTGEDATLGRLRPARPVGQGGAGAFEVAARYHALSMDEEAIPVFIDPTDNARSARSVTLGVNWYLTENARIMANAERTSFSAPDGFDDPPAEIVFIGRLQLSI